MNAYNCKKCIIFSSKWIPYLFWISLEVNVYNEGEIARKVFNSVQISSFNLFALSFASTKCLQRIPASKFYNILPWDALEYWMHLQHLLMVYELPEMLSVHGVCRDIFDTRISCSQKWHFRKRWIMHNIAWISARLNYFTNICRSKQVLIEEYSM